MQDGGKRAVFLLTVLLTATSIEDFNKPLFPYLGPRPFHFFCTAAVFFSSSTGPVRSIVIVLLLFVPIVVVGTASSIQKTS